MTDRREIDRVVAAALDEDAPYGDLTSQTLIPDGRDGHRRARRPEPGVLSGGEVFAAAFRLVDPRTRSSCWPPTATRFDAGAVLARVTGRPAPCCTPSAWP